MRASGNRLNSINAGEVTYVALPTENTGAGDSDGDGVIANLDNCPLVANPTQADADGNGIGDACEPTPLVQCVAKRASDYLAVFGYRNQYADRRIAVGPNNKFSPGAIGRGQPTLQRLGQTSHAVAVPFTGSITWTLAGSSATATQQSTACNGLDLTHVNFGNNVVLYASGDMRLADRTRVNGVGTLVNAGSGTTEIGASANVGDVLSQANVSARSAAVVNGIVRTAGTVTKQGGVQLLGGMEEHAVLGLPALSWSVTFPPATGGDVRLEPGAPLRSLNPGSYGEVLLKNNTKVVLSSGTYYMNSLDLEPGSTLQLNQAAGAVTIYVRSSIIYRSSITAQGGAQPKLVLGYFGSNAAFLESALTGAVVAPNANLVLGQASPNAVYTGSFFAKSVETRPDTKLQFAAIGP
jgi:hypothetical protein